MTNNIKKISIALITTTIVAIIAITGISNNKINAEQKPKKVVATQIALSDGDVQLTYNDKTTKTLKAKNVQTMYDGDKIIEIYDGSVILYNTEKDNYIFYPDVMGDWCIEVDNMQQLNDCVVTYLNNSNGMNAY
ncbi:hypothetical protein UT300009_30580 [Paraclostridium bifermentans]